MIYGQKFINIENIESMDFDSVIPEENYHFKELNYLLKDNLLKISEGNILFDFKVSQSAQSYKEAISAYTFVDLFRACAKNEFSNEINNNEAKIEVILAENITAFTLITINNTDVELFLNRIQFLITAFLITVDKYNQTIKDAVSKAKWIQVAE